MTFNEFMMFIEYLEPPKIKVDTKETHGVEVDVKEF
jgi:hypothetical protein